MRLEELVSSMMTINVKARLWHWSTESAQHHTTYEAFLTQNEVFTDSLVESVLGNDHALNLKEVGVGQGHVAEYKHLAAVSDLKNYRSSVAEFKLLLEKKEDGASAEYITILDNVTENISKTLYLLRLK